jgi:hypothetical protein
MLLDSQSRKIEYLELSVLQDIPSRLSAVNNYSICTVIFFNGWDLFYLIFLNR